MSRATKRIRCLHKCARVFQAEPAPALWVPAPSHGCETCLRSGRDPTFPPASLRQSFYCCLFSSCPAQSLDLSLCFIPQNPPPREQGAGVFMLRSRMLGLILPCTPLPFSFYSLGLVSSPGLLPAPRRGFWLPQASRFSLPSTLTPSSSQTT